MEQKFRYECESLGLQWLEVARTENMYRNDRKCHGGFGNSAGELGRRIQGLEKRLRGI